MIKNNSRYGQAAVDYILGVLAQKNLLINIYKKAENSIFSNKIDTGKQTAIKSNIRWCKSCNRCTGRNTESLCKIRCGKEI